MRSYSRSTLNFLATQFGRWHAEELTSEPAKILYCDYMQSLTEVAATMDRLGCLGDGYRCLTHLYLAGRNIMVELGPDDTVDITGILDWGSAVFAPKFVSCAPPWWL